jgi:hypothetical protein
MENLKEKQEWLRHEITCVVQKHIDTTDNIKEGLIVVNKRTHQVSLSYTIPDDTNTECIYSISDFVVPYRLWYVPEEIAIEAVVQEYYPNYNIKTVVDGAYAEIRKFLAISKPLHLRTCGISIGIRTCSIDCFDEQNPKHIEMSDDELLEIEGTLDDDNLWETADTIPMHRIVSKTEDGYRILKFRLIMLVLNYIDPE